MAQTLTSLTAEVTHALGGSISSTLSATDIVNEAGRAFYAAHNWVFRKRADRYLAYSVLSIADADWTESSLTLTLSSSFSSYLHVAGAVFTATGGTGVTTGDYNIVSKTSDNAIVLASSLSSGGGNLSGVVDGTLALPYVTLPSDFGEILSLRTSDSLDSRVCLVSPEEIARLRIAGGDTSQDVRAALVYPARDDATDAFGTPRLEVYPTPTASDTDAMVMSYRADWTELSIGTDKVAVPLYAEMMLKEFVRAVALGREEEYGGSVAQRLDAIQKTESFKSLIRRDQQAQRQFGPIRRTAWDKARAGRGVSFSNTRSGLVADPS